MRLESKFEFKEFYNDNDTVEASIVIVVGLNQHGNELDIVQVSKALKAATSAFSKEIRNR